MSDKIPMTVVGAERLREELQRLKSKDRPAVIEAIAEARAKGDLSENAEYDAAKEQQGFIEGRIREIESVPMVRTRLRNRSRSACTSSNRLSSFRRATASTG